MKSEEKIKLIDKELKECHAEVKTDKKHTERRNRNDAIKKYMIGNNKNYM